MSVSCSLFFENDIVQVVYIVITISSLLRQGIHRRQDQSRRFRPGTEILDFGTGGGFPGIPLAILFPDCRFKLIDGTSKKIRVAQEVSQAIGLRNCQPEHLRGEDEKGRYDFIVSRAVMPLPREDRPQEHLQDPAQRPA